MPLLCVTCLARPNVAVQGAGKFYLRLTPRPFIPRYLKVVLGSRCLPGLSNKLAEPLSHLYNNLVIPDSSISNASQPNVRRWMDGYEEKPRVERSI